MILLSNYIFVCFIIIQLYVDMYVRICMYVLCIGHQRKHITTNIPEERSSEFSLSIMYHTKRTFGHT